MTNFHRGAFSGSTHTSINWKNTSLSTTTNFKNKNASGPAKSEKKTKVAEIKVTRKQRNENDNTLLSITPGKNIVRSSTTKIKNNSKQKPEQRKPQVTSDTSSMATPSTIPNATLKKLWHRQLVKVRILNDNETITFGEKDFYNRNIKINNRKTHVLKLTPPIVVAWIYKLARALSEGNKRNRFFIYSDRIIKHLDDIKLDMIYFLLFQFSKNMAFTIPWKAEVL